MELFLPTASRGEILKVVMRVLCSFSGPDGEMIQELSEEPMQKIPLFSPCSLLLLPGGASTRTRDGEKGGGGEAGGASRALREGEPGFLGCP